VDCVEDNLIHIQQSISDKCLASVGPIVLELVDAIMHAIYKLEVDESLLSQVLPMIWTMEDHGKQFSEKYPELCVKSQQKRGMPPVSRSRDDMFAKNTA
jgi:hypothetical protein